jgi:ribosomal protein L37E
MIDKNHFKNVSKKRNAEEFLDSRESILWRGIPKKFAYVLGKTISMAPIAILWLAFDLTFIILSATLGDVGAMWFILIPFFAVHMTPVWIWLAGLIKAAKETKTIEYVITDKRIIEFKGETKYISSQIFLKDLKGATLKRNIVDRILRVGDIYIEEKGGKELVLFDTPNSEFMHTKILELCGEKTKKDEFYENHIDCDHCGSYYDNKSSKCPNCGAPKESKANKK